MQIRNQPYPFTDSDGGINWDAITPTFGTTTDTYQFYLAGVLKKTIVITYVDSTKEVISGVAKT
ncbi:hypothetical protein EOM57_04455 [Candidatus Saccharibacteria bacterium]|nr:hypothetical protein [Candidatus Saccharibacteria bacterium]